MMEKFKRQRLFTNGSIGSCIHSFYCRSSLR